MSERLETIINELGLNLVYCYENLNLEETIPFIFFRHNFYEIIRKKKLGMSPIGGLPKGSAPSGLENKY
jgi:hypothetical protein